MERRLAAILAADVVGYTRLMGSDEDGTLQRLTELRQDVLEPLINEHHGRIVKLMGDGLLVEFASVVDAVTCSLAWQKQVGNHEPKGNGKTRLQFRIGINLGDVIVQDGDIHGDGVNIAARLEGLAEPGGNCLSDDAYRQAKGKTEALFDDMGEQDLKNVAEPVRVYRIAVGRPADGKALPKSNTLALPDKPSIAVLPFTNMSGDPEQEYFSDGITEDIITELSRFPTLFVIARNSSFHFKGKATKVNEVGIDLGVQYVVEGSVRKAGNRVRVTAQLVETTSGNHIWAERYDRELEDIFEVQDEVARTVAATVSGRLDEAGAERARRQPTEDLAAYDLFLRAYQHVHRWTRADLAAARPLLEKALDLDPDFARAHAYLGMVHVADWMWGVGADDALDRALVLALRALSLDDDDSWSYVVVAHVYMRTNRLDEALNYMEKAVALNPNDAVATAIMGKVVHLLGHPDEAVVWVEKAMRLDPYHPDWFFDMLGRALYMSRRYEEACATFKRMKQPPNWVYVALAACYGQLDEHDQARATVAAFEKAVERERPEGNTLAAIDLAKRGAGMYYKNQNDTDHWLEGLRKAGLKA